MKLIGNKKGVFGLEMLSPAVISIVIVAVVAVLGLQLLGDQQDDLITNTNGCNATVTSGCDAGYNATADAIEGVSKFPEKLPMIAGVIVLVIIIAVLIRAFRQ